MKRPRFIIGFAKFHQKFASGTPVAKRTSGLECRSTACHRRIQNSSNSYNLLCNNMLRQYQLPRRHLKNPFSGLKCGVCLLDSARYSRWSLQWRN